VDENNSIGENMNKRIILAILSSSVLSFSVCGNALAGDDNIYEVVADRFLKSEINNINGRPLDAKYLEELLTEFKKSETYQSKVENNGIFSDEEAIGLAVGVARMQNRFSQAAKQYSDMNQTAEYFGLDLVDVKGDGNCAYHALSHQLGVKSDDLKKIAQKHIDANSQYYKGMIDNSGGGGEQGDDATHAAIARELGVQIVVVKDDEINPYIYTPENYSRTAIIFYKGENNIGHYWSTSGKYNDNLKEKIEQAKNRKLPSTYAMTQKEERDKIKEIIPSAIQNFTDKDIALTEKGEKASKKFENNEEIEQFMHDSFLNGKFVDYFTYKTFKLRKDTHVALKKYIEENNVDPSKEDVKKVVYDFLQQISTKEELSKYLELPEDFFMNKIKLVGNSGGYEQYKFQQEIDKLLEGLKENGYTHIDGKKIDSNLISNIYEERGGLHSDAEFASIPKSHEAPHANVLAIASATRHVLNQRVNNLSLIASGQEEEKENGAWVQGFGGLSRDTSVTDVKSRTHFAGVALGYEKFVSDNLAIGAAFTFVDGAAKYGTSEKVQSKTYIGSIYGLSHIDNVLINGSVFFGGGDAKTTRQVASDTLAGKPKTTVYGAIAELGYKIDCQDHSFIPSISAQYASMDQAKYQEKGALNTQSYGKRTSQLFEGIVAGKYQYAMQTEQGLVLPSIKIGIVRDLKLKSNNLKFKLESGEDAKFIIRNEKKQRTIFFASPEILVKNDNFDFALSYTLEQGKKFSGHLFGAKVMAKF
jgi:hypothetical protein